MDASHLVSLKEKYCIPYDIELLAPFPDERVCYLRLEYVAISEFLLKAGLRLPLYPSLELFLGYMGKLLPSSFQMHGLN